VSPLGARSAKTSESGPALPASATTATQLVRPARGLLVTATWLRDPRVIEQALGVRSLVSTAAARTRIAPRAAAAAQSTARAAGVFTGLGFDACATPSGGQMRAWSASPYRGVGIYIGGANLACSQPSLTPAWVDARLAAGWHLIPTYVGLQSPSASCGCAPINPATATAQGAAAATDAVARAGALGIGPGNPIYEDIEAYTRTPGVSATVLAFLRGWTTTLHADGYLSGIYANTTSGVPDVVGGFGSGYPEPDDIWIAAWNGLRTTADPRVPPDEWGVHQRLHQYEGAHDETYAGVTINIDSNYVDGATAGEESTPLAAPAAKTVIPDGSFVEVSGTTNVYEIAGDAPLLVEDWADVGGIAPVTQITRAQFSGLNSVTANGTFLTTESGAAYRVAGGAPLLVSSWAGFGGAQRAVLIDQWDIDNAGNPLAHLNPFPANGTFLRTTTGAIYRVAGGAALGVSSWARVGGVRPAVVIDEWDIDHIVDPPAHLNAVPAGGTLVEGLPSRTYWEFVGGRRKAVAPTPAAVAVDDLALLPFADVPRAPRRAVLAARS